MRIMGSIFLLFLAQLWRRELRAVTGELSLLGSLQKKDSSPIAGLRVARKLHVLPCDMLQGWRKVGRAACEQKSASSEGHVWG